MTTPAPGPRAGAACRPPPPGSGLAQDGAVENPACPPRTPTRAGCAPPSGRPFLPRVAPPRLRGSSGSDPRRRPPVDRERNPEAAQDLGAPGRGGGEDEPMDGTQSSWDRAYASGDELRIARTIQEFRCSRLAAPARVLVCALILHAPVGALRGQPAGRRRRRHGRARTAAAERGVVLRPRRDRANEPRAGQPGPGADYARRGRAALRLHPARGHRTGRPRDRRTEPSTWPSGPSGGSGNPRRASSSPAASTPSSRRPPRSRAWAPGTRTWAGFSWPRAAGAPRVWTGTPATSSAFLSAGTSGDDAWFLGQALRYAAGERWTLMAEILGRVPTGERVRDGPLRRRRTVLGCGELPRRGAGGLGYRAGRPRCNRRPSD